MSGIHRRATECPGCQTGFGQLLFAVTDAIIPDIYPHKSRSRGMWRDTVRSVPGRSQPLDRQHRFTVLYETAHRPLLGYVLRRVEQPADAADLLADIFVVAWRRLDQVPEGPEGILWLYGVARRSIANHHRGLRRQDAAVDRLRREFGRMVALMEVEQGDSSVLAALHRLREQDRELLTLTNWEGLSPAETARVLGIQPGAARVRLHRARARLRSELERASDADDHAMMRNGLPHGQERTRRDA